MPHCYHLIDVFINDNGYIEPLSHVLPGNSATQTLMRILTYSGHVAGFNSFVAWLERNKELDTNAIQAKAQFSEEWDEIAKVEALGINGEGEETEMPCTGNMYSCPCADCVDEREFYFAQDPCDWGTGETMEQANQRSLAEI